jgi:hypothetical protein
MAAVTVRPAHVTHHRACHASAPWAKIGHWAWPVVSSLMLNLAYALFIFFSILKFIFSINFQEIDLN